MTIYECDVCGERIKKSQRYRLIVNDVENYDICEDCYEDFLKFISSKCKEETKQ